jgi:hypothetical protein
MNQQLKSRNFRTSLNRDIMRWFLSVDDIDTGLDESFSCSCSEDSDISTDTPMSDSSVGIWRSILDEADWLLRGTALSKGGGALMKDFVGGGGGTGLLTTGSETLKTGDS